MKRYKIISKTRFYLFITLVFIITSMMFILLSSSIEAHSINFKNNYKELVIVEGDTLWDIALRHKPNTYDIRYMVFKIKELNDLDTSYILPGSTIKVPIY